MNKILAFILEVFGIGKRKWHYTHNSYSQHIIDYLSRVVDPFTAYNARNDPYMPRPLLCGDIECRDSRGGAFPYLPKAWNYGNGYNTLDELIAWSYGKD